MKPKKSLGQHFLTSHAIIAHIIVAANIQPHNHILEIGPGRGVLTKSLLTTGAHITCVEKDNELIPNLEKIFAKEIASKQLCLIHGDILDFDVSSWLSGNTFDIQEYVLGGHEYKIVANIPYYITGQILRMFLESKTQPESMTLLVQKEVADRIIARDMKESLLSLSVKIFGEPSLVRKVARGSFNPPPSVDSAIINIRNISKKRFEDINMQTFFSIIHAGFAHKRKQLLPNLTALFLKQNLIEAFVSCNIDIHTRAEDVTLLRWICLVQKLQKLLI